MESSETSLVYHQTKPALSSRGICWWLAVGIGPTWGLNWLGLWGWVWDVCRVRIPGPNIQLCCLKMAFSLQLYLRASVKMQRAAGLTSPGTFQPINANQEPTAGLSALSWINKMLLFASTKFSFSLLSLPLCQMRPWAVGIQRWREQRLCPEDLASENVSVAFSCFLYKVCNTVTVVLFCFLPLKPPAPSVPTGIAFRTRMCLDNDLVPKVTETQGNKWPY